MCHDVQVRRGMTPKKWLEALWEGRVFVTDQDDYNPSPDWKPEEPPEGMPSLTRIENILKTNNFPVVTDYGAKGYVVDEVSPGFLRIRLSRFEVDHEQALRPVIPALHAAGYAAMITCGTGSYSNHAEILVAPRPVPKGSGGRDVYFHTSGLAEAAKFRALLKKPRPVSQAMIREDVWQILLQSPFSGYRDFTFADMQSSAKEVLDEELTWKAEEEAFRARDPRTIPDAERHAMETKLFRRTMDRHERDTVFRSSVRAYEGVSGFALREAFDLGLELSASREDLDRFITQDMAETAYVQLVYSRLHGQWHPSTNSGQDPAWKAHRTFLQALMKIAEDQENESEEPPV
jgi:hypothetical protein